MLFPYVLYVLSFDITNKSILCTNCLPVPNQTNRRIFQFSWTSNDILKLFSRAQKMRFLRIHNTDIDILLLYII